MVGLLCWRDAGGLPWPCRPEETQILRLRLLSLRIPRGRRTAEAVLRRRLYRAGARLLRRGARRVLLPPDAPAAALPEGLRAADTLPLRQGLAAAWALSLLRRRGQGPDARVLVTAESLSGSVAQAVTALSLRQRYLMLSVPYGGEALSARLRREYGVSVLLNPAARQCAQAALHLAFSPAKRQGAGAFLPVYGEEIPLPPLRLPPEVEERLPAPEAVDRGALLSLLWETGRLRPGQVTVCLEDPAPA